VRVIQCTAKGFRLGLRGGELEKVGEEMVPAEGKHSFEVWTMVNLAGMSLWILRNPFVSENLLSIIRMLFLDIFRNNA
jgi:hypothetical protein